MAWPGSCATLSQTSRTIPFSNLPRAYGSKITRYQFVKNLHHQPPSPQKYLALSPRFIQHPEPPKTHRNSKGNSANTRFVSFLIIHRGACTAPPEVALAGEGSTPVRARAGCSRAHKRSPNHSEPQISSCRAFKCGCFKRGWLEKLVSPPCPLAARCYHIKSQRFHVSPGRLAHPDTFRPG